MRNCGNETRKAVCKRIGNAGNDGILKTDNDLFDSELVSFVGLWFMEGGFLAASRTIHY
jgi:hypothetical protein